MPAGIPTAPDGQDPRATLHAAIQYIRNESERMGMPCISRALDRFVVMLEEIMTETRVHDPPAGRRRQSADPEFSEI